MTNDDAEPIRLLLDRLARAVSNGELATIADSIEADAQAFIPGIPIVEGRTAILNELRRILGTWHFDLRVGCSEVGVMQRSGFCSGTFGLRSSCISDRKIRYTDAKFLGLLRKGADDKWRVYRICWSSNLPSSTGTRHSES